MNRCNKVRLIILLIIYKSSYCICEECPIGHLCKGRCELFGDLRYCICEPGETNWDCKSDLDLCNKDCIVEGTSAICSKLLCNNGTCNNIPVEPFYSCDCGPFYTGQNCNIENNPCVLSDANPCGNGRCEFIQGINKINCHCNPGWKARDSETNYTIDWQGVKVIIDPPCIERAFYGISKIAPHLTQGNRAIWYIIFGILLIFFVWQFYMLCVTIATIKSNKSKQGKTDVKTPT